MSRTSIRLRGAVRRLLRAPAFSLTAFLTLALAVGALTAAFAVVDALLLRPLPYPESELLVEVGYGVPGYGFDELPFSVGTFVHTEDEQRSFSEFAIYYDSERYNVGLDDPERIPVARVTPGFFAVFRSPPELGRPFTPDDREPGAEPVVVVSHDLWQRRWGGDPELVGRKIHVDGVDRRVVGIAAPGFGFPDRSTGLWVPFTIDPANLAPTSFGYPGVARLAEGVSVASARADLRRITARLTDVYPDRITPTWVERGEFHSYVAPLKQQVVGHVRTQVWLVFGTAGLLLLLAVANVGNLFMVRTEARSREMALRRALGSSRSGIAGILLAESVILGIASGTAGLVLAALLLRLTTGLAPPDLPRVDEIAMNPGVAMLGLGAAALVAAIYALLPLLALRRGRIADALQADGRSGTGSPAVRRLQSGLVVSQVALAAALVIGAGLLARSFGNLISVDPGFRTEERTAFEIGLPTREYDPGERARTWIRLADRFRRIGSVEAGGGAGFLPLSGDFRTGPLHVEGEELPAGESGPVVDVKRVTPGYFAAMGIPVLEGRDLTREDGPGGFPAVVANRTLVDRHLGGTGLGRRVRLTRRGEYAEIVGVVGDVRTESFREPPGPHLYFPPGTTTPASPSVPASMSFVVHSATAPERLVPDLRRAVAEIDPRLPLGSVVGLQELADRHLARHRLVAVVLLAMAGMGLILAAVGVYGVVAYVVVRRRREVGVRMALGASAGRVLGRYMARVSALAAVGALVGAALAWAGGRLLEAVLFQVESTDPVAWSSALGLVVVVALTAGLVPSWRATRTDPSQILRTE